MPEDYDFEAHKKLVPMQLGDVPVTYADTSALEEDYGFKPIRVCVRDCGCLRSGIRCFMKYRIIKSIDRRCFQERLELIDSFA